jgi:hypothetical protein
MLKITVLLLSLLAAYLAFNTYRRDHV